MTNNSHTRQVIIYGKHCVHNVLLDKKRKCYTLLILKKNYHSLIAPYQQTIANNHPNLKIVVKDSFDKQDHGNFDKINHQGFLLFSSPKKQPCISKINFASLTRHILILDQITDAHNVGAIIRNAVAFNAEMIFTTQNNSLTDEAILARTSVGHYDNIPFIAVNSMHTLMRKLKSHGYWIAGLDGKANQPINQCNLGTKIGIVLGSEANGIRPLIKKNCDALYTIPMYNEVESLNVASASAVMLYHINNLSTP